MALSRTHFNSHFYVVVIFPRGQRVDDFDGFPANPNHSFGQIQDIGRGANFCWLVVGGIANAALLVVDGDLASLHEHGHRNIAIDQIVQQLVIVASISIYIICEINVFTTRYMSDVLSQAHNYRITLNFCAKV